MKFDIRKLRSGIWVYVQYFKCQIPGLGSIIVVLFLRLLHRLCFPGLCLLLLLLLLQLILLALLLQLELVLLLLLVLYLLGIPLLLYRGVPPLV